jgi:hypothetical protein
MKFFSPLRLAGAACGLWLLSVTTSPAGLPPWKEDSAAQWFGEHPDPNQWPDAMEKITRDLTAEHTAKGREVFTRDENFSRWFTHLRWVAAGSYSKKIQSDPASLKAFVEAGSKPALSHEWIRSLTAFDKGPASLEILLQLQQAHPSDLADFPALGVAYAIVFDQPFPKNWPHHQVAPSDLPKGDPDPVARFADMVQAQKDNQLDLDPRKLGVHELRFVVDTLAPLGELAWARKNVKQSTGKFDQVFSSIRYDNPRLLRGQFQWMLGPYTLASIQKNGGICVDQAYYACTAGKARGLPTLYFSGQGSGGGHAWFGYMEKPGRWNPDCGRYESQNYPVGEALNPQTWQPINDSELEWMVADLPKNPAYGPARDALAWARVQRGKKSPEEVLQQVRDARELLPSWPEPWMEEAALLQEAEPGVRKAFFTSWIKNFDKQSDLKVIGQQQLLEILKKEEDPAVAQLQKDIVRENRKKRFDLGIGAGAEAIFEKIDGGDWEGAEKEFKGVIRKFDEQGGGNLFYQLIQPYVISCLEDAQWKRAETALEYAEKKMEVGSQSILAREFSELRAKVENKWQPPGSNVGGL